MKNLLQNIYIRFIILFYFLLLVSCNKDKKVKHDDPILSVNFDEKKVEKKYQSLSPKNQWNFIKVVMDSSYDNTANVEEWLLNKLALKKQDTLGLSVSTLRDLNTSAFEKNYSDFSEKIARFVIATPKNSPYQSVRVDAIANLSHYFNNLKQKDSLQKYVDQFYVYVKNDTTKSMNLLYHANKANLESLDGDFFEAAVNYHKAIDLTSRKEKIKIGTLYHNLATMYLNMNYLDKAKTYIDSSLQIITLEKYPTQLYNSLGIVQSKTKDFKNAEITFQNIIKLAKEKEMKGLLAQSYANYANLKRRRGLYDEALFYIKSSDTLCRELGIDFGILINKINSAEVYYDQGNFDEAIHVLRSVEPEVLRYNLLEINKEYYDISYRVYEAVGDENISNAYYRLYSKVNEKFTGDLPRSVITEWELSQEKEKLNRLNLVVNEQKKTNYFYGFLTSLVLLVFLVIYFFVSKKHLKEKEELKRIQQKSTFELELKSKELLTSSLKNISIQQSKSFIKQELEAIIDEIPIEYQTKLLSLITKLDNKTPDAFIADFENRFLGIYESFYQKLKLISSELTPNETIICAMLRLNYSSKEIAFLTNRTIRTIENNRSIIRKKLKLDADVNLQQFLLSI